MSNEKKSRFRIKWADREVEYYGDQAKAAYDDLIEHVKSIPIQTVASTLTPSPLPTPSPTPSPQPPVVESKEMGLISRDCGIPIGQLSQLLEFKEFEGFPELVPYLPRHPENGDATLLVFYALQVGLQKSQLEVSYVKKILSEPNGYPLPGRAFGLILQDFRQRNWTITSQTRGKYKPFTLSADGGLAAARELLRRSL
jgi:hypothetical protein